jgi:hypothetical protein
VRPLIYFKETVVPLLPYLLFEYRNSALLRGVISMNSLGRWPIFFFISYYSFKPNTSSKVHRENGLFEAEILDPVCSRFHRALRRPVRFMRRAPTETRFWWGSRFWADAVAGRPGANFGFNQPTRCRARDTGLCAGRPGTGPVSLGYASADLA